MPAYPRKTGGPNRRSRPRLDAEESDHVYDDAAGPAAFVLDIRDTARPILAGSADGPVPACSRGYHGDLGRIPVELDHRRGAVDLVSACAGFPAHGAGGSVLLGTGAA